MATCHAAKLDAIAAQSQDLATFAELGAEVEPVDFAEFAQMAEGEADAGDADDWSEPDYDDDDQSDDEPIELAELASGSTMGSSVQGSPHTGLNYTLNRG